MAKIYFTAEHEWIRPEDGVAAAGITDYAQKQLGDIVFVELPQIGQKTTKGAAAAVVELVKAANEVYAPVTGEVVAVNETLADRPELVNASPMGDGWFFKLKLSNPAELSGLMDEAAYRKYVEGLS